MRFGEFLAANKIEELSGGYVDYARLTAIFEQNTWALRRVSIDDGVQIGSALMPVQTDWSPIKSAKKANRWLMHKFAVAGAYAAQVTEQVTRAGHQRSPPNQAGEDAATPLLRQPMESSSAKRLSFDAVAADEAYEEFVLCLHEELHRCNHFVSHLISDLEASLDNLITATSASVRRSARSLNGAAGGPSTSGMFSDESHNEEELRAGEVFRNEDPLSPLSKKFTGRSAMHRPSTIVSSLLSKNDAVQQAYKELYLRMLQVKQMTTMNLTGFLKAAKKCKKNTKHAATEEVDFPSQPCCSSGEVDQLAEKISHGYAKAFTGGNLNKARSKLLVYKASMRPSLKVGFFLGVDTCLACVLIWVVAYPSKESDCPFCLEALMEAMPVYRVIILPLIFVWCWSFLVYTWRSYGINYLWILDINPKTELGIMGSASLAATMTCLLLLSIILYLVALKTGFLFLSIPMFCYPLGLIILSLLILVAPPGMFYFKTRKWFFQTIGTIFQRVLAPLGPEVRFRENYVADVLTSMVAWIVDLETTFMYYLSGDGFHPGIDENKHGKFPTAHLITAIPYWYRAQQCLRRYVDTQDPWHLVNCGKYLTSLASICLAAIGNYVRLDGWWDTGKVAWIVMLFVTTIYCYLWDICMDWGLFSKKGMRKNLAFANAKWFYYFAMVTNLIGRLGWAFTITPHSIIPGLGKVSSATIAASVEILRRCQWTLLRVECEYIENPTSYRSIAQVPVLLTFKNEKEQIHPMRATLIAGANTLLVVVVVTVAFIHYRNIPHPHEPHG